MKLVYVAGRYRADTVRGIVENIRAAEAVAVIETEGERASL